MTYESILQARAEHTQATLLGMLDLVAQTEAYLATIPGTVAWAQTK